MPSRRVETSHPMAIRPKEDERKPADHLLPAMSARRQLLRWANGFALANAALFAIVGLRYLWLYSPLAPLPGWTYAGLAFVGHLSALAYAPLVLLAPVMLLIPWPRL